jgi:uncharacterized protein (TIGR02301 family)
MSKQFLAAIIIISACLSGPARAEDAAAPFDGDLQRLAEILGTLHYLRGICGSNEGPKWRNEMQALIDAETPSGDRRARMIAGFNRGYNGFQQTYRTCTPAAAVAIRRYIEEGSKISRDLTARYANSRRGSQGLFAPAARCHRPIWTNRFNLNLRINLS